MIRRYQLATMAICAGVALSVLAGCSRKKSSAVDMAGQDLFDLNCALCHEMSNPDLHKQPPKLEHLFQAKTLPSGAPATDEQVRKTIVEGRGTMPAFDRRLQPEEVGHIVRYLHTFQ
ncbi:MAG TPA: cytochrome c [Terriglobales bacterium]|nr:cytochrome c [Terriglobales bacterium]